MRQVKFFKSVENELGTMETELNEWLTSSGVELISVSGNIAPQAGKHELDSFSASDVLVIVVYETDKPAQ